MSDIYTVTIRVTPDGRAHRFDYGAGLDPMFQVVQRAWIRAGRPVVTVEGLTASGRPNGNRAVIDLITGRGPANKLTGLYPQVWFWGRALPPLQLKPAVFDLAGLRAWWCQSVGARRAACPVAAGWS